MNEGFRFYFKAQRVKVYRLLAGRHCLVLLFWQEKVVGLIFTVKFEYQSAQYLRDMMAFKRVSCMKKCAQKVKYAVKLKNTRYNCWL